jgi:hypothetical protein
MDLSALITRGANWPGWRRHAPAAGSGLVHIVIGLAAANALAAMGAPVLGVPAIPEPPAIEIALVADALPGAVSAVRPPPPDRTPKAPPPAKSEPASQAAPPVSAPRPKDQKQQAAQAGPSASKEDGGVYLGPASPFALIGPRGGLDGLAKSDPCMSPYGLKPRDCPVNWAARVGTMDSILPRSKEELRKQFAEFIEPCPYKVGCEGGEWVSNNGTRSVYSYNGSPMMSGAGGLGGVNELTGRLGFNPDHVDPGFGD